MLGDLARDAGLTVYTQDDPSFPETVPGRIDDTALDISHRLKIEIVPTLIRFEAGARSTRTLWLGPWRVAALERRRRARPRSARGTTRLRRQECRAGGDRTPENPLQRNRAQIAPHRNRRGRGRAGGDVRARLVGRAAIGAADRGACAAHARRHGARPAGGLGAGPAGACRGDRREDRGQCRDGRLQAGISAGRAGGGRGGARRELCDARRVGDDDVCRAGGRRQRPDPPPDRHERQGQRARPRQPRQCRDRPRLAAGDPQHRRGTAAGGRPLPPSAIPANSPIALPKTRRGRAGSRCRSSAV